jgi:hypothetical protein
VKQVNGMDVVLTPSTEAEGQPVEVQVEVGLSDGVNTQIVRGLQAGDKVLVEYSTSTASNNQNNRGPNAQFEGGQQFFVAPSGGGGQEFIGPPPGQ